MLTFLVAMLSMLSIFYLLSSLPYLEPEELPHIKSICKILGTQSGFYRQTLCLLNAKPFIFFFYFCWPPVTNTRTARTLSYFRIVQYEWLRLKRKISHSIFSVAVLGSSCSICANVALGICAINNKKQDFK